MRFPLRSLPVLSGLALLTLLHQAPAPAASPGNELAATAGLQNGAPQEPRSSLGGVVVDTATGRPLENVNVYLAGTTIGTSSRIDGSFQLAEIPRGAYQLVFSRVGYELVTLSLQFTRAATRSFHVAMRSRDILLGDVEVSAEDPAEWQNNLRRFRAEFIGETANAKQCAILNPEVVNFRVDSTDMLIATSDRPLQVENRGLGYVLHIALVVFRWSVGDRTRGQFVAYPRYEPLAAKDGQEMQYWEENRLKAFYGSLYHFLWALTHNRLKEEGFFVRSGPESEVTSSRGGMLGRWAYDLEDEQGSTLKRWRFNNILRVDYWGKSQTTTSYLKLLTTSVTIDQDGVLQDPLALQIAGDWMGRRVADALPFDLIHALCQERLTRSPVEE